MATHSSVPAWRISGAGVQFSSVAQSCPTLSDPMDYSPPGSSIHGILQARVLEWGAIAFSGTELRLPINQIIGKENKNAFTTK